MALSGIKPLAFREHDILLRLERAPSARIAQVLSTLLWCRIKTDQCTVLHRSDPLRVFCGRRLSENETQELILRFLLWQIPIESVVMAVGLLVQLAEGDEMPRFANPSIFRFLLGTSILVSDKYCSDEWFGNKEYHQREFVSLSLVNQMERCFLGIINFSCYRWEMQERARFLDRIDSAMSSLLLPLTHFPPAQQPLMIIAKPTTTSHVTEGPSKLVSLRGSSSAPTKAIMEGKTRKPVTIPLPRLAVFSGTCNKTTNEFLKPDQKAKLNSNFQPHMREHPQWIVIALGTMAERGSTIHRRRLFGPSGCGSSHNMTDSATFALRAASSQLCQKLLQTGFA